MVNLNNIEAAIFDMDGVIVDNDKYHLQAYEQFCIMKGFRFSEPDFCTKYFGRSNHDILCGITGKQLTHEETSIMGEEKEQIYRRLYSPFIAPIPGLLPFLDELKKAGKKIALASSAPTSNVDFVVDSLKIRHFFDVLVDSHMVSQAKPNPEIYLKAASLLGVTPTKCVVFEDSHAGIRSAQGAGMQVVALATTHSREELKYMPHIIDSYCDLDPLR